MLMQIAASSPQAQRRMELRFVPLLVGALGLLAFFVIYRSLPLDFGCSSRCILEAGQSRGYECCRNDAILVEEVRTKSIAQFLREKVEQGLSEDQLQNKELVGLDFSSKVLLSEVLKTLRADTGTLTQPFEEGVLNYKYGVLRVVNRIVVCSSYRTSLRDFTVLALSPDFTSPTSNPDYKDLPRKDPSVYRTCTWLSDGTARALRFDSMQAMNGTGRSSVGDGVVRFRWLDENHGTSYDVLLIHCSFPEPVGTDRAGGFLYLNFSHDTLGSELAPVFHEQAKTLNASLFEATSFRYEFAFCSAPVFTNLTPIHVKQFLMYHHALFNGGVHFFIYESMEVDPQTMAVLQPLIDAGFLTVIDFRKEKQYHTWYHSQDLALNDCLYRTRFLARWSLFWDLDEYLHIRPPFTLGALLQEHEDAAWISFGKIDFSPNHCSESLGSNGVWAVETMLYRQASPICGEMCNGDRGARKWMGNPRKVRAGRIHYVADPSAGAVIPTSIARFNHYRGLVAPRGRNICQQIVDPRVANSTKDVDRKKILQKDDELAAVVQTSLKRSVESLEMFGGAGPTLE